MPPSINRRVHATIDISEYSKNGHSYRKPLISFTYCTYSVIASYKCGVDAGQMKTTTRFTSKYFKIFSVNRGILFQRLVQRFTTSNPWRNFNAPQ